MDVGNEIGKKLAAAEALGMCFFSSLARAISLLGFVHLAHSLHVYICVFGWVGVSLPVSVCAI